MKYIIILALLALVLVSGCVDVIDKWYCPTKSSYCNYPECNPYTYFVDGVCATEEEVIETQMNYETETWCNEFTYICRITKLEKKVLWYEESQTPTVAISEGDLPENPADCMCSKFCKRKGFEIGKAWYSNINVESLADLELQEDGLYSGNCRCVNPYAEECETEQINGTKIETNCKTVQEYNSEAYPFSDFNAMKKWCIADCLEWDECIGSNGGCASNCLCWDNEPCATPPPEPECVGMECLKEFINEDAVMPERLDIDNNQACSGLGCIVGNVTRYYLWWLM